MKFYSTRKNAPELSFREAVIEGLAPDYGLYFPENIPQLPKEFFNDLSTLSLPEIAAAVLKNYVQDDIPEEDLKKITEDVFNFPIPIVEVEKGIHSLELYHGPTLAFKDVGARFLARCLNYFNKDEQPVRILVATSGDTGSAVAHGFYEVPGVEVFILYPEGKVSPNQEKQFAALGKNITCLAIDGTFDDCQRLVKEAFADPELKQAQRLSSANSINVARWLPQSVYYFHAYGQLAAKGAADKVVFSVPSGNFGNLTAGVLAWSMGLPVEHFLACTNVNKVVPEYLESGDYQPRPSVATLSNAMDVGAPSNFERMTEFFEGVHKDVTGMISGCFYTDEETMEGLAKLKEANGYLADPHGIIGYMGLKDYQKHNKVQGIFLETAHPAKFPETVEKATQAPVEFPERLKKWMERPALSDKLPAEYSALKEYLQKH